MTLDATCPILPRKLNYTKDIFCQPRQGTQCPYVSKQPIREEWLLSVLTKRGSISYLGDIGLSSTKSKRRLKNHYQSTPIPITIRNKSTMRKALEVPSISRLLCNS